MDIKYSLFNPTGNITALVETPVSVENQPKIAEQILEKEKLCEQVGFVCPGDGEADIIMRMAGGEFCGNATMSAAALYCEKEKLKEGRNLSVRVKVIGTGIVPVDIEVKDGKYGGKISMPKPLSIDRVFLEYNGEGYEFPIVHFEGISHMITTRVIPDEIAVKAIGKWCQDLQLSVLGIMFYNEQNNYLRPLVYVKEPETLFWERSCASGTTALGAYLFSGDNEKRGYEFEEPGGRLTISLSEKGDYILGGTVAPI